VLYIKKRVSKFGWDVSVVDLTSSEIKVLAEDVIISIANHVIRMEVHKNGA